MALMAQPLFNALWSTANVLGHPLFIPIYGFFWSKVETHGLRFNG